MWRGALALAICAALAPSSAFADQTSAERVRELRERLAQAPGDGEARLELALELSRENQPAEALRELDLFAALHPRDHTSDLLRAQVLVSLGRGGEAEELLDRAIDAGAGSFAAHWLRARVREARGDAAGALEDYDAALAHGSSVELHLARGALLERSGDLDRAVEGYEAALVRHGGAYSIREALVRTERRRGRPERALVHADALIAASRSAPRWRVLRAEILVELGRTGEAREERRHALEDADRSLVVRRSPLALVERARARLALGQRAEAIADLELALRRAPDLDEARRLLSAARRR